MTELRNNTCERERVSAAPRRSFLKSVGLGALTCPFALGAAQAQMANPHLTPQSNGHVTDAPLLDVASPKDRVECYGRHQAGITTPRPAHGMVASFDLVAETPDEFESSLKQLSERIKFLTIGGTPPALDPLLPPSDSGILGPFIYPDALTITVSLGSALFDRHSWLKAHKPRKLQQMTKFANDALNADLCHGDLSLQICANTQDTTIHALRDILKTMARRLVLRWKQEGNVPVISAAPGSQTESARNFLGFRDGSANPDSNNQMLMDNIVWVTAARDEPAWAQGGSYQAVRIIRNFVERWDRTPFREQELIFGRKKMSGAALGGGSDDEFVPPDYAKDPEGKITPLDAHIRLANPRIPETEKNLILRRPFNYSNGITKSAQLDQGLLFICYQSDLEEGFITVQHRLDGEPLEEYIRPVGGGYFFALPGMSNDQAYIGESLIQAVKTA